MSDQDVIERMAAEAATSYAKVNMFDSTVDQQEEAWENAMKAAARVLLAHAAASQARMPDVPFDVPSYAIAIGVGDVTAKEPNDEQ